MAGGTKSDRLSPPLGQVAAGGKRNVGTAKNPTTFSSGTFRTYQPHNRAFVAQINLIPTPLIDSLQALRTVAQLLFTSN